MEHKVDSVEEPRALRVAMLGCGVVGSQVARLIIEQADDLASRIGARLELVGIAVGNPTRERPGLDPALFFGDAEALVSRDDLDIVIEVVGGIDPVRDWVATALEGGASVITANKALIAAHGAELTEIARLRGVDLYYEAAVAGAIPIIRPLRESLVGDEITRVMGIVNGTTNYILDQMTTTGAEFADALGEAQDLGYAEADPTADVEGHDAAAKAAILASLAFHTDITSDQVASQGISQLTSRDISSAAGLNMVIKLLAVAELTPADQVSVRVNPVMLPTAHPLASIKGAYNAVFVESREAGRLMFMGPGAGGAPTASAVMGDLVTAARNRVRGVAGAAPTAYTRRSVADPGGTESRYHLRFVVLDEPGVLARAADVFARHAVSIATVHQAATSSENGTPYAELEVLTHLTRESTVQACVAELTAQDFIGDREDGAGKVRLLRVEASS
ncbi:homoserine dehydrogenase [Aestuariimicrobium sp. p3-SID1156]|uniref:homoserine dehydrogenase n=1 Tax=Aestuariimicrobium sp. p3-SID1156 TaxID=2916038 RepID=UPI00223B062D|nr:homoserine dehydrogenase [Aestuariimicrobium sp. p3-SID1156]MCT1459431.1 homoserine dehydrogenase [Aestuariimicrobium sp. p3-SID1156]